MSIHFDKVTRRTKNMREAKLKMSEFRLALDQIDHYTRIEKDALQALQSSLSQKRTILSRYVSATRQMKAGHMDEREFKDLRSELRRELKAITSEVKEMKRIDKRVHQKLREPMRNFKDSFKAFKKLLRS
jgi:small-conductance mechanosensitive channel